MHWAPWGVTAVIVIFVRLKEPQRTCCSRSHAINLRELYLKPKTHHGVGKRKWGHWEVIRSWAFVNGISDLLRERSSAPFHHVRMPWEVHGPHPRSGLSLETDQAGTMMLHFQPPGLSLSNSAGYDGQGSVLGRCTVPEKDCSSFGPTCLLETVPPHCFGFLSLFLI